MAARKAWSSDSMRRRIGSLSITIKDWHRFSAEIFITAFRNRICHPSSTLVYFGQPDIRAPGVWRECTRSVLALLLPKSKARTLRVLLLQAFGRLHTLFF